MKGSVADQERFVALLESHQRLVLKVCWAYGGSDHDRDDLFQEIVARLWAGFPSFDPQRKFSTWMYRVALNVAIDYRRHRGRRFRDVVQLDEQQSPAVDHRQDAQRDQQLLQLRELLDQQNDPDRAILLLYLDGNSYQEIGEVLGVSASNVGTRLSRIKQSLRKSVQDADHEEQEHS